MPRPPVAPPTGELPSLDEGDECTEIFGRQASGAIAGLAVSAPAPAVDTAVEPVDDYTSPTLVAFEVEVSRGLRAAHAPSSEVHTAPTLLAFEVEVSRSLSSSEVLDDHDEVDTRTDTSTVAIDDAGPTIQIPEPPPTRDLEGAMPAEPLAALSSSDQAVEDDELATMVADIDLMATRPLPQASAADLAAADLAAAGGPTSSRGPYSGPMMLTPLVPPLPSVASLATVSGDRSNGALPPPRPPTLSTAALRMPGRGSSAPGSHAPLGSPPAARASLGSSPPAAKVSSGSSPPAAAKASAPPGVLAAPAAVKLSSMGMDFDDATLVKPGEEELPILLQRRKSVPPAAASPVPGSGPHAASAQVETASEAPKPARRGGLFGRLLSLVLG